MDPAVVKAILKSTLPAAALALVVFALVWRSRRDRPAPGLVVRSAHERSWLGPIVIGAAAILTHYLLHGAVLPGAASDSWYPVIALAAGALGLLDALGVPRIASLAAQAAALAAIAWLYTRTQPASTLAMNAAFVLAGLAVIAGLNTFANTTRGVAAPLVACVWAAAISQFAMLLRSSQVDAYPAVTLAAVMGAAGAVALWRPALTLAWGTMTTLGVIGCANIYRAQTLGDGVPWHSAAVLPLLALGAIAPALLPRTTKKGLIISVAAGVLCALGAAVLCFVLAPPPLE